MLSRLPVLRCCQLCCPPSSKGLHSFYSCALQRPPATERQGTKVRLHCLLWDVHQSRPRRSPVQAWKVSLSGPYVAPGCWDTGSCQSRTSREKRKANLLVSHSTLWVLTTCVPCVPALPLSADVVCSHAASPSSGLQVLCSDFCSALSAWL